MSSYRTPPKDGFRNVPPPQGGKASVYSRFIPREELNSFSAWNPDSLSDGPGPGPAAAPRRPGVSRPAPAEPQQDVAAEHARQLRASRQSGYQDGYRDGLAALEAFKQSFAQQTSAQIGQLVAACGAQLDGLQQAMARALAVSATQMARQIVRSELATRPELVAEVAQEALDTLLLSARHITLRAHPDDLPLVAQGAAEVLAARGARLLADPTLTRGGCIVESDIGIVDASLEARWRRAAASLGIGAAWDGQIDSVFGALGDERDGDRA